MRRQFQRSRYQLKYFRCTNLLACFAVIATVSCFRFDATEMRRQSRWLILYESGAGDIICGTHYVHGLDYFYTSIIQETLLHRIKSKYVDR